ncbi:MAG: hypothetical protein RJB19_1103, partial [Pseudomonadota bacterium]
VDQEGCDVLIGQGRNNAAHVEGL